MSFKFRSRLTPLILLGVCLFSAVSLMGCGGGNGSSGFTSSVTRRATSTVKFSGASTALLDINVATDNSVSGTMKIDDGVRSVQSRAIVAT